MKLSMIKKVHMINLLFTFMSYFVSYRKAPHGVHAFSRFHSYFGKMKIILYTIKHTEQIKKF